MLNKTQLRAIVDKMGVLQDGHFVLRGGWHAPQGVFPMRVLQQPEYAASLGATLGSTYRTLRPQVVLASPGEGALLGMSLAKAVAARLVLCTNEAGVWKVCAGQSIGPDERVVIVEDMITDPAELAGRVDLVKASGATLLGVAALFDMSPSGDLPWPLEALVRPDLPLRHPAHCPQCQAGVPLTDPGACLTF